MKTKLTIVALALILTACATTPMGPTVQVLPAPNKPFEVFQQDQIVCKQYAEQQVAGQADSANKSAAGTAAIGTGIGLLIGMATGNDHGAGVGAAIGLGAGTLAGTGKTQNTESSIQHQYNNAYVQCMYSKGNQIGRY